MLDEDVINTRLMNYLDQDSGNRCETEFSLPYEKGIILAPNILEKAISTEGGVHFDAIDNPLMLKSVPDIFCAGEMLDWEAPIEGHLISAALATGQWAGVKAINFLKQ